MGVSRQDTHSYPAIDCIQSSYTARIPKHPLRSHLFRPAMRQHSMTQRHLSSSNNPQPSPSDSHTLSPSHHAAKAPKTRAALDDLAKVSEGSKQAQRFQNFSNTAGGITGQLLLTGIPTYAGGLLGMAGSMVSQYGAGKLLASPGFARWLVGASKTTNPVAHINRLSSIAAKESPIAAELSGLKQALLSAVNDNPATTRAAASDPDQNNRQQ